ncbi:DUF1877 family protein [Virgisporangium aliadipatigenens]|nr:DUF1877 family protein [Virgisporangium aliadipatigenens]
MGTWTWLARIAADDMARLLADPLPAARTSDALAGVHPHVRPVAGMDTHRAWHALHIALTGLEEGGDPPASHVVGDGAIRLDDEGLNVLMPDDVRAVAQYLATVAFEELRAARHERMRADAYSFDVVEEALPRIFAELVRFYADAAAAGDAVVKSRA